MEVSSRILGDYWKKKYEGKRKKQLWEPWALHELCCQAPALLSCALRNRQLCRAQLQQEGEMP